MKERFFGPIRFIPGENRGKYPLVSNSMVAKEGGGIAGSDNT